MPQHRCFFMSGEHVESVAVIDVALDHEAIQKAEELFRDKGARFSTFEVWDLARVVHRHSD